MVQFEFYHRRVCGQQSGRQLFLPKGPNDLGWNLSFHTDSLGTCRGFSIRATQIPCVPGGLDSLGSGLGADGDEAVVLEPARPTRETTAASAPVGVGCAPQNLFQEQGTIMPGLSSCGFSIIQRQGRKESFVNQL